LALAIGWLPCSQTDSRKAPTIEFDIHSELSGASWPPTIGDCDCGVCQGRFAEIYGRWIDRADGLRALPARPFFNRAVISSSSRLQASWRLIPPQLGSPTQTGGGLRRRNRKRVDHPGVTLEASEWA
jgi:hypothetical protein